MTRSSRRSRTFRPADRRRGLDRARHEESIGGLGRHGGVALEGASRASGRSGRGDRGHSGGGCMRSRLLMTRSSRKTPMPRRRDQIPVRGGVRWGAAAAPALVAFAVVVLGGCSAGNGAAEPSPTPSVAQRWVDEIDGVLGASSTSDLERAVLADHWVTDAELAQAADAYGACVRRYGLEPLFEGHVETGTYGAGTTPESQWAFQDASGDADKASAQVPRIEDRCGNESSYTDIGWYFYQMRANPTAKTSSRSVATCSWGAGSPRSRGRRTARSRRRWRTRRGPTVPTSRPASTRRGPRSTRRGDPPGSIDRQHSRARTAGRGQGRARAGHGQRARANRESGERWQVVVVGGSVARR